MPRIKRDLAVAGLVRLLKQVPAPEGQDWLAPLKPYFDAVNRGQPLPQVGRFDRERVSRLLDQLTGKNDQQAAAFVTQDGDVVRLLGQDAYAAGVNAALREAVDVPFREPLGCLGWLLRSRNPKVNSYLGHEPERLMKSFIARLDVAYGSGVASVALSPRMHVADLCLPMLAQGEGTYWRYETPAHQRMYVRALLVVFVAVDAYLRSVISGDVKHAAKVAPWLEVFSGVLPIGRLARQPNIWLFLRP